MVRERLPLNLDIVILFLSYKIYTPIYTTKLLKLLFLDFVYSVFYFFTLLLFVFLL